MTKAVMKHGISSELAQKMVDAAVAKAGEIGVRENVAILDDGGNLKAFSRMDGAPILCIEIAQNKAYTALFGVSTQEATRRFWPACPRLRVWRRGEGDFPLRWTEKLSGVRLDHLRPRHASQLDVSLVRRIQGLFCSPFSPL